MRKLFVIALVLALVPFTVGCGLWDFGEDNGNTYSGTTPPSSETYVPLSIELPATIDAAVRANIMAFAAVDAKYYFVSSTDDSETEFSFDKSTRKLTLSVKAKDMSTESTNYKFKFRIKYLGQTYNIFLTVPMDLQTTTSGTTITASTVTVTISSLAISSDGTVTIKFTVTYTTAAGTSTTTTEVTVTGTNTAALLPSKVVYAGTTAAPLTTELELNGTTATENIDWTAPVFKLYFNQAVTKPTSFTFVASATDSTKKTNVSLSQTDTDILTVALDTTGKILTVTVKGQNSTINKSLNPGTNYSVAVSGTVTSSTDTTKTLTVTSQTYLFKTAQTKLYSWNALTSATGTSTSGGEYVVGVTTTSPTVTWSTTNGIAVTFDYPIADNATKLSALNTVLTAATFELVGGNTTSPATTTSTLTYGSYFTTATASNGGKTIYMPLKTTGGKPKLAGASSITFKSGAFIDNNGKSITTTNTIAFTAN